MNERIPAAVLFVLLLAAPTRAEEPAAPSRAEALALELLEISGVKDAMGNAMTTYVDSQIRVNPSIEPFRDTMIDWASKAMRWEEIGPKMARVYLEVFSEEELAALVAFQRSPVGSKVREKQPELLRRCMEIGETAALRHRGDLERMIREKQQQLEREAEGTPAPPSGEPGETGKPNG